MKGYDYLKKALDGELKSKTIIKTINKLGNLEMNKEFDNNYDYYIYENDNMFHRCNKDGKLGAKYQDRFLNYKVLEKDFEFYCVLEEEKKIPERVLNAEVFDVPKLNNMELSNIVLTNKEDIKIIKDTLNKVLDYLKSKGE